MTVMDGMLDPQDPRLAQAWEILQAQNDLGLSLEPDSNRLAFADPEFLLRREARGIRFQLELLKPDLEMKARGIEHTIVVFGSAVVLKLVQRWPVIIQLGAGVLAFTAAKMMFSEPMLRDALAAGGMVCPIGATAGEWAGLEPDLQETVKRFHLLQLEYQHIEHY